MILLNFFFFNLFLIFFFILKDVYSYNISKKELYQRLGFIKQNNYYIDYLIHGSSCGEVITSLPIIKLLKNKNKKFIISAGTLTGYRLIKRKVKYSIPKPYDSFLTILIFYYLIRPKNIIIIESDVWPIMISIGKLLNINIILINYIFKEKKPLRNLFHRLVANKIYVREKLNFFNSQYKYLGNIKYLNKPSESNYILKKKCLSILCAYKNELNIHFNVIKYCIENDIKIIYIPRHLNFIDDIKGKFSFFKPIFINNDIKNIERILNNNNLIVVNCFGLTNKLLEFSKVTIMGGTFNTIQGHNILEPIYKLNYVIVGPHHETIKSTIRTINYKNIIVKIDQQDIYSIISNIINNYNIKDLLFIINTIKNNNKKLLEKLNNII